MIIVVLLKHGLFNEEGLVKYMMLQFKNREEKVK